MKRWNSIARKTAAVLAAGVLLQAAACTPEALLSPILQRLVSDLVFGALNAPLRF